MTDQRIPILYIAPWIDLGGSDKGTIDWFKHIDRERWAPSLITTQPSENRWLHHVEPFAEEVWQLPDLMPGERFPEFILGFIESRGVRVVHIMNARMGFDLLPDMACLPQPPAVVVQIHAEEPNQAGYVRYVSRRYGNLVDAFSVTSEQLKRVVADYEIAPSRIETILSGVDAEAEFNPALIEPFDLGASGPPRILWPGRLVEQKDPMLTLEALALVKERGSEFVLDVVGDGEMKEEVQRRAAALGLADSITWNPPSQEMPRWYRTADLLLMTSVYEGVPYVIYEALAMGVPVVAPAIPGNVEFMDADSGALIDPRDDAAGYAEALVGLLDDEERRRALGERSRQRMLEKFSLADMGRRHGELYDRLLASRPATGRWRDAAPLGDDDEAAPEPARAPTVDLGRDPAPERSVGVIVPCYRHGIFLADCIASIKAQTLPPAQIVVVDDGSDDPETQNALEVLDADPAVTVVRQPRNLGPSAARNRGLRELSTAYVLPIDADDELLPDALERMLAQLEQAPADVGFIYPHAQHFGNRSDYVQLPAYNLWLLMQENYCPAPALFDRRVFGEGGVSYAEEIVVGHEDWDLILALAECGVSGRHADGPTFRYRRLGFSRINAVDYGPQEFHRAIAQRHPGLYANSDAIKARWAPALSVVLLGEGAAWDDAALAGAAGQTCQDFELLARPGCAEPARAVAGDPDAEWLEAALGAARGRWVLLLPPNLGTLFADRSFLEKLLFAFLADPMTVAVALAVATDRRAVLSQLDDAERLAAEPAGLAFARLPEASLPPISVDPANPFAALATELQVHGTVQWRAVPAPSAGPTRPSPAASSLALSISFDRSGDRSELATLDTLALQRPRLSELTAGTVRRWDRSETWIPPGTVPLCRHVQRGGALRVLSTDREPPPGFDLEYVLGAVHTHASPGMLRLVQVGQEFELSEEQNELGKDRIGYGYVEALPLPQMIPIEVRVLPGGGQHLLVAGPDDPLAGVGELADRMGWIEPQPILPRGAIVHSGPWGADPLYRTFDPAQRRHRYATVGAELPEGSVLACLGSLLRREAPDRVELRLRSDGRLVTDLAEPGRASRHPAKVGRWVAGQSPGAPGGRAAGDVGRRVGMLARHAGGRKRSTDRGVGLGWLLREASRGCQPLISATHPVTGDQLVTGNAAEAIGNGYQPDGVLGYALAAGAAAHVPQR